MSRVPQWRFSKSGDLFLGRDEESFMAKLYNGYFGLLAETMAWLYCPEAKTVTWNYLPRWKSIRLNWCLSYQPAAWLFRQNLSGLTVLSHKLWVRPPTASAVRDLNLFGFSQWRAAWETDFFAVICWKVKGMKSVWILDALGPESSVLSQYILFLWCVTFGFIIRNIL